MPHPPRLLLKRPKMHPGAAASERVVQSLSAVVVVDGDVRHVLHTLDLVDVVSMWRVGAAARFVGAVLVPYVGTECTTLEAHYADGSREVVAAAATAWWAGELRRVAQAAADYLLDVGRYDLAEPLIPALTVAVDEEPLF